MNYEGNSYFGMKKQYNISLKNQYNLMEDKYILKGISRIINNDYYTSPKDRCFYLYINTNNTNFLFQFATSTKSEIINYLSDIQEDMEIQIIIFLFDSFKEDKFVKIYSNLPNQDYFKMFEITPNNDNVDYKICDLSQIPSSLNKFIEVLQK